MERQQSCASYLEHQSFPSTPFHQSQPSKAVIGGYNMLHGLKAQTGRKVNLGGTLIENMYLFQSIQIKSTDYLLFVYFSCAYC